LRIRSIALPRAQGIAGGVSVHCKGGRASVAQVPASGPSSAAQVVIPPRWLDLRLCYNLPRAMHDDEQRAFFSQFKKDFSHCCFAVKAAGYRRKRAVDSWTLSGQAAVVSIGPWRAGKSAGHGRAILADCFCAHSQFHTAQAERLAARLLRLLPRNFSQGWRRLLPLRRLRSDQRRRLSWFAQYSPRDRPKNLTACSRDARAITAARLARWLSRQCRASRAVRTADRRLGPHRPCFAITVRSKKRFRSANSLAPTTCKLIWMEQERGMPLLSFSNQS